MAQTSISIHIQASTEKVFAAVAEIDSFPQRAEAIQKVEFLTKQHSGVGTRFRETRLLNGRESKTELEVTEYEPDLPERRIRMVSDQGGTIWDTVFVVTDSGSGSTLNLKMDARPYKLVARIMTPLISGMIKKFIQKDMDDLKTWCEAGH
ncbi:SRPBCC family protein [Mariniblastus fucicola]|uniref:Polyketide cyclase / dehydrase and lipid transport n=1 Tax=Mariniblastus fucicola TaxID=980251 RepID=A0A5B9PH01_9BACT|nr:SRPBCC family protein [Mariniblastus fucicola]QEG24042.1 Polyketide cyclase / dehydrase and lipid transport [Mariniblastus fucicola]